MLDLPLSEHHVETHQGVRSTLGLNSWFKNAPNKLMAVDVGIAPYGFTSTLMTSIASVTMVCYARFAIDQQIGNPKSGFAELSPYGSVVLGVVGGPMALLMHIRIA